MPLAMKSPTPRSLVVLCVVLALLLAGELEIVLVLPLTTNAVPPGTREYVVPSITISPLGCRVEAELSTYSTVPERVVAVMVFPSTMIAGAEVTGPSPFVGDSVDVTPLIITTEPDAESGKEKVVPETVMTPPGVRVWSGPKTKAVVPWAMFAVIASLLSGRTGRCEGLRRKVCPLITMVEPEPDTGRL
jgi:hypothetical protein